MRSLTRIGLAFLFLVQLSSIGLGQSGIITTYAGPVPVNGSLATSQAIEWLSSVAPDGAGGFYVASDYQNRVYRVTADGRLSLVAGNGTFGFSGDGRADILWRHSTTGLIYIWLMDGTDATALAPLGTAADPAWQIDSFGNFSGDNETDILWRNNVTGQLYVWLMNGANPPVEASPGTVSDLAWLIQK